jgi:glucuronoarabinoxylan endo-1,4-beta-xylanase
MMRDPARSNKRRGFWYEGRRKDPNMKLPRACDVLLVALICLSASRAEGADVKVDSTVRYQTMDGFGTCTYIYSDAMEAYQKQDFQDLYMGDLGASLMRMEISPDAQPEPDLDLDHLNLDKLHMEVRSVKLNGTAFAAMQKRYPGKLRIFASLWTPPGWMKDSNTTAGGGHLRPDRMQHLGKYIAAFCIDFEKTFGVHIYAVSLQNELAFSEFYNSCIYTPETFRDTIKAVKEQMNKWGCTTLLMGPEDVGAGSDFQVQREMGYIHAAELDPAADKALDLFNVHGYADDKTSSSGGTTSSWAQLRDQIQGYNTRLWQTETSGDHPKWPDAMHVALDIHEAVAYGNCSGWAYWQILDPGKPDDYALLGSLDPTAKKYCAAKHYFKYIRPGAVRILTTGDSA